jgi:hypothetical protein
LLGHIAMRIERQGVFLSLCLLVMIVTCLGAAALISGSVSWTIVGRLLLFLELLPLIDAPFDWTSLEHFPHDVDHQVYPACLK